MVNLLRLSEANKQLTLAGAATCAEPYPNCDVVAGAISGCAVTNASLPVPLLLPRESWTAYNLQMLYHGIRVASNQVLLRNGHLHVYMEFRSRLRLEIQ